MLFVTLQEEDSLQQGEWQPRREQGAHHEREEAGLDWREAAGTAGRGEGMAAWQYRKGRVTCNKGGKGFKQRG